jgi:hypothetical protein
MNYYEEFGIPRDSAVVNGAPAETASQAESPRANFGGAG